MTGPDVISPDAAPVHRHAELRRLQVLARGISPEARLWLAIAPEWSLRLAEACRFPVLEGHTVQGVLEAMSELGLCERTRRRGEALYFTHDSVRDNVIAAHRTGDDDPVPAIVYTIGQRLLKVPGLAESHRVWAELAVHAKDLPELLCILREWAHDRLAPRDVLAPHDANTSNLAWLAHLRRAARQLAFLASEIGHLAADIDLRIELELRRADDRRRLERFVEPGEAIRAFEALIRDESAWALHIVGLGGLGKSMLVRHLTVVRAQSMACVAARVDFDHLRPDYPDREPWLLLEHLADQFRLYGGTAGELFEKFDHIRLSYRARTVSSHDDPRLVDDFAELISAFVVAVGAIRISAGDGLQLVEPHRVVVLLDTCEELEKVRRTIALPPSLHATFRLVEALHAALPRLRVVFAGRRLIASAGAGWTSHQAPISWPSRPYLRLYELRGLTTSESRALISRRSTDTERLGEQPLIDALLTRSSQSLASTYKVEPPPPTPICHNPFDLDLLISWVCDDPKVRAETLLAASDDQYVEFRIIHRLTEHGLREVLPTVALLERFDREILRVAIADPDVGNHDEIWSTLERQEWITSEGDQLQIAPKLCRRLDAWLLAQDPRDYHRNAARVTTRLAAWTLEQPGEDLAIEACLALIRVARRECTCLAKWWPACELRLASVGRHDAIEDIAGAARAIVGGSSEEANLTGLMFAVSHAAVASRRGCASAHEWSDLLLAVVHTDAPDLGARAALALLALERNDAEPALMAAIEALAAPKFVGAQILVGAVAAALTAVVERFERGTPDLLTDATMEALTTALEAAEAPAVARAWVTGTWAMLQCFRGELPAAQETFARALTQASAVHGPAGFVEWEAPREIELLLRAEMVRYMYPTGLDAAGAQAVLAERIESARAHCRDDLDADRFLALSTHIDAALGPVAAQPDGMAALEVPSRRVLHRAVPPFAVALAEALASIGEVPRARGLVIAARAATESASLEETNARHADLVHLRIRLGWRLEMQSFDTPTFGEEPPGVLEMAARQGLLNPTVWAPLGAAPLGAAPLGNHARWRASVADPAVSALHEARAQLRALARACEQPLLRSALELDAIEADLLTGNDPPQELALPTGARDLEALFVLQLRRSALLPGSRVDIAPRRIGVRRAAAVALDEGGMLALRLPSHACAPLRTAAGLYAQAGDTIGRLFACTLLTLASLRCGANVRELRASLQAAYQPVAQRFTLPPWSVLSTSAVHPLADDQAHWQCWLILIRAAAGELAPDHVRAGTEAVLVSSSLRRGPEVASRRYAPPSVVGLAHTILDVTAQKARGELQVSRRIISKIPYTIAAPGAASRHSVKLIVGPVDGAPVFDCGGDPEPISDLAPTGVPLELRLAPEDCGAPWEELFARNAVEVCRVVPNTRVRERDESPYHHVAAWTLDQPTERMLAKLWPRFESYHPEGLPDFLHVDLFHCIGLPMTVRTDVRLRPIASVESSRGLDSHGTLVHPDDLSARLAKTRLCIVQGPALRSRERGPQECRDLALLRIFGARLARALPVIVVPSLPMKVFEEFAPALARRLQPRLTWSVFNELRADLERVAPAFAHDLCIYAPSLLTAWGATDPS